MNDWFMMHSLKDKVENMEREEIINALEEYAGRAMNFYKAFFRKG